MKFEHLVEINDLLNPLIDTLTRSQLWRGLVLRAEQPGDFVLGLDRCRVVDRSGDEVAREMHFGSLVIHDRVRLEADTRVRYLTMAPADLAGSSLIMSIEEPHPGQLYVRFEYENIRIDRAEAAAAFFDEFRCAAYTQADIDTIKTIRRYASEGRLNDPPAGS